MESNETSKRGTSGWRRFLIFGASGVVLGALIVVANGIVGGAYSLRLQPLRQPALVVEVRGMDLRQSRFLRVSSAITLAQEKPLEPEEASDPLYVEKVPGPIEMQPITLEREYRGRDALFSWRMQAERGSRQPRDVAITLNDPRNGVRRLTLERAWPSGWDGPLRDATGNAYERITLTAERVREGG